MSLSKNAEKNPSRPFLQISGTTGGLPVSTLMTSPSSCARGPTNEQAPKTN
ncbi:hypothetical protein UUU_31380 [Klebsiella pneumoniae subsp. pneumoniae DSM 30104 = JCM 1662 = NBRC 14940]|nr:hypothetical protein UUU_31380 [Klebsiella pneumoniae subsp. pneumoniae DSM 30104 = JCM 1662 = NBRC 14940]